MADVPWNRRWLTGSTAGLGLLVALLTGCGQSDGANQAEPDPLDSLDQNPEPAPAGDCEAEPLDWPASGRPDGSVVVSSDGAYAAVAVRDTGDFVVWHDGEARVVTAVDRDGARIVLNGVNSDGVVIGQDYGDNADAVVRFAWHASGGELRELDGTDHGGVQLAGINDAGTIVETEQQLPEEPFYGNEIRVWPKGSAKATTLRLDVKKGKSAKVSAISEEGLLAGALFDGESVELGGEYSFQGRIWKPDGEAIKVPVDEFDALAIDLAGGWVIVSAETNHYRWKFTTDEKPVKLNEFNASVVDESGRVYGSVGADEDAIPGVFDTEAHELPVPGDVEPVPADPREYPVPDTVTDTAGNGSVLVGTWKGNPVRWTCGS